MYALFRSFTCRRKTNEFQQVKFKDADKCLFLKDDHAENFGDFQVGREVQHCFFRKISIMPLFHNLFICSVFSMCSLLVSAQGTAAEKLEMAPTNIKFLSLENAPDFDKKRFWVSASTGFGLYAGASYAMWDAWYKDFPLTGFHTFNDMKEWKKVPQLKTL